MFATKFRLPAKKLSNSLVFHSSLFTVFLQKNTQGYNRYGFVVSKKVDKRAVVRNKTKRETRSFVEVLSPRLLLGNDILFVLKHAILEASKDAKEREMLALFSKAGLLSQE